MAVTKRNVIAIAIFFGILTWALEALVDYLFFGLGSYREALISNVTAHEIYMRALFVAGIFVFGLVVSRLLARQEQIAKALAWEVGVNAAIAGLARALIAQSSIDDMADRVLMEAQRLTGSTFGYVGYIDPHTGYLVSPTMTRDVYDLCQVPNKDIVFKELRGLFGWVLTERKPLLTNSPLEDPRSAGTPKGHIPIERFLSAPALIGGRLVGQVAVANPGRDYTEQDLALVERLASIYAVALQRHWAEEELAAARERAVVTLRSIGDAVLTTDGNGRIEMMNGVAERLTGWNEAEAAGKASHEVLNLFVEQDMSPHRDVVRHVLETGEPVGMANHTILVAKDGAQRFIADSAAPIRNRSGDVEGVIVVFRDVTQAREHERERQRLLEQVQFEQTRTAELAMALHRERDLLQTISENTDTCLAYLDPEFNFVRVNSAYARQARRDQASLIGRNHFELYPHEENRAIFERVRDTGEPAEYRAKPFEYPDQPERGTTYWDWTLIPVKDDSGQVSGLVLSLTDVTDAVIAHRRIEELVTQLEEHNRDLDAFARMVAHDLKNPLSLMKFASILEEDYATMSDEEIREALHVIGQSTRWMTNIINELLLLAELRDKEVELQPLDMEALVSEVREWLSYMVEEQGAEISAPAEWPPALGHGPWVQQVWVNYISNALKYGHGTEGQPPHIELGATTQPDGMVRCWVRDHGPGLTPEEQAKVFIPFKQGTHLRARGHGLGLSIVQHIVGKLGGQVGVESQPGEGATFWFTLPGESGR